MEHLKLAEDIQVLMVQAKSFPDKIVEAFQALEKLHPTIAERPFYGVSWLDAKGKIIYNAAAPEKCEGEAEALGCPNFVIRKGNYLTETVPDFMKNPGQIGLAFEKLLARPEANKEYPCIEYYESRDEVICMVRMADQE